MNEPQIVCVDCGRVEYREDMAREERGTERVIGGKVKPRDVYVCKAGRGCRAQAVEP